MYLCQALALPRLSEPIYNYLSIYVNTIDIKISDNLYLWIIPRKLPDLPQNLQVNKNSQNSVTHQGSYTLSKAWLPTSDYLQVTTVIIVTNNKVLN